MSNVAQRLVLGSTFVMAVIASTWRVSGADQPARIVRLSGTIEAIRSVTIQVPSITDQRRDMLLARLVPNGASVKQGDVIAEFDRSELLKLAREAEAKYGDLSHQVEQKIAEQSSNVEKRASDLQAAEADLAKAEIEIRKGPVLSDIEQQKNAIKLADARLHVESLKRSNRAHERAEKAELRILELQRDRQKYVVTRQEHNANLLELRAPISGMVSLQNVFRNNVLGHAQEGDQLWPGSSLMRLFDPSAMQLEVAVNEPDGAVLVPGAKATVRLDAYPSLAFKAHLDSASPVASASLGSPVRSFAARFVLEGSDPHLLPDLSAAIDVEVPR